MMLIKLLTIAIVSILYFIGGAFWHNARRFILPVVLAGVICWITRSWHGIIILPVIGVLCLGYGEKSPFRKTLSDAGARGMYLFLACLVIGLAMLVTGHLAWYFFIPYAIGAGIIGATLRNINQWIGDPIFGAWIGSVVVFIR